MVELHTGTYCDVVAEGDPAREAHELQRLKRPPNMARPSASKFTQATGSSFESARTIAAIPQIVELNIGHFLIGEAIFLGLDETVKAMRIAMDEGRAQAGS